MLRGTSIALGIGLVILWLVGLSDHATLWLTWLDGLAGLAAFGVAAVASDQATGGATVTMARTAGGPLGISLGLYILWIIGLATHAERWLTWWTFAFACAFLIFGFLGSSQRTTGGVRTTRIA